MNAFSSPLTPSERLRRLKAAPRARGEASFFWYESHFDLVAVKVLPGEYFVSNEDILIMTTLGSCIAACLWDPQARIGGLNHFLLPDAGTSGGGDVGGGRYGAFAMEQLINELMKRGARRNALEAKVFGGGRVVAGMDSAQVGERNTRFVLDYLKTERIHVVSKDVLDIYPRKVCYVPSTGKAMVKRLPATQAAELAVLERRAAASAVGGGSVDLF